jgi:hypothetical protein
VFGTNQQMEVSPRVGVVVDTHRGAAGQRLHGFADASFRPSQRPRSPSPRGSEHDVDRAARRYRTRELAPPAPHRASMLESGIAEEVGS